MLLNIIANSFLILSQDIVIIPAIVLGYIWLDQKLFYHAICLLLLSMILNVALKLTFRVPGFSGYAFPSGHMQLVVVFYGWLAYQIRNSFFRAAMLVVILGVGFGLIHFGYHNITDVLGAVVVAIGLIALYRASMIFFSKNLPYLTIIVATVLFAYNAIYAVYPQKASLLGYYALLGFVFSEKLFHKKLSRTQALSTKRKILSSLLCFSLIAIIYYGSFQLQHLHKELPLYVTELQWLAIGFILPFSRACRFTKKH